MHKTTGETGAFFQELYRRIPRTPPFPVWIFPPYTALSTALKQGGWVRIGAQNMHEEDWGAYTGEISAPMLLELGVSGVILGHSERRRYEGEDDMRVKRKFLQAKKAGLFAILCVGEPEEVRDQGEHKPWVTRQLQVVLEGVRPPLSPFAIAYEPIWAIGTGRNATPDEAGEMHRHIRHTLAELGLPAETIPILYGGSVSPENSAALLRAPEVDGLLIGGASLSPEKFSAIILEAEALANPG